MTTASDLTDELEGLANDATAGPWNVDQDRADGFAPWVKAVNPSDPEPFWVCGLADMGGDEEQKNAALIVALRNNLPLILSALRRVEVMEKALKRLADAADFYGINYLDTDDLDEVAIELQEATLAARQALTGEA